MKSFIKVADVSWRLQSGKSVTGALKGLKDWTDARCRFTLAGRIALLVSAFYVRAVAMSGAELPTEAVVNKLWDLVLKASDLADNLKEVYLVTTHLQTVTQENVALKNLKGKGKGKQETSTAQAIHEGSLAPVAPWTKQKPAKKKRSAPAVEGDGSASGSKASKKEAAKEAGLW